MPYCARDLLAVDGMVLQSSLFLSLVTAGGRSVQGILIAIMMADPVHKRAVAPARRFLSVFLPAERGQIEIVVRSGQQISAASVGRVGVKHVFTVSQEDAQAVGFALCEIGLALAQEFCFVCIIILYG